MPVLPSSSYTRAPRYQFNGHLQTVLPALLRRVATPYSRERITLPDGDFLDLDWLQAGHRQLVVLTHGLEGSSTRHYMKGMANAFARSSWDVLAWNCRSCSGEMNRSFRMYNHGDTEDIGYVIEHALGKGQYDRVVLVGFSMGGSILLKYLGVKGKAVPEPVRGGIAFSSPCDLKASVDALEFPGNSFYKRRFFNSLSEKVKEKARRFPGRLPAEKLKDIQYWREFDELFSAPLGGYRDAADFYRQASAKNYMGETARPALLVNAMNDPILPEACSPVSLCQSHPLLYLERPHQGGHVGFSWPGNAQAWSEHRALEFAASHLS